EQGPGIAQKLALRLLLHALIEGGKQPIPFMVGRRGCEETGTGVKSRSSCFGRVAPHQARQDYFANEGRSPAGLGCESLDDRVQARQRVLFYGPPEQEGNMSIPPIHVTKE